MLLASLHVKNYMLVALFLFRQLSKQPKTHTHTHTQPPRGQSKGTTKAGTAPSARWSLLAVDGVRVSELAQQGGHAWLALGTRGPLCTQEIQATQHWDCVWVSLQVKSGPAGVGWGLEVGGGMSSQPFPVGGRKTS